MSAAPLRDFVQALTRLEDRAPDDAAWLDAAEPLLAALLAGDAWLPAACAVPGPGYRQYLLHCDPLERFSVVSFVWGVGARTPVHNHLVAGLVGMLRGAETSTALRPGAAGPMVEGETELLRPGQLVRVTAHPDDAHWVANADPAGPSISIHAYRGNIGAVSRHSFDPATGERRPFISGYSNDAVPNLWDRSR